MDYKVTIGIEVHCELKTKEKIFSPSNSCYGSMANTNVNIIDLGYPGSLPLLNTEVLRFAIRACKVLNLKITRDMHFDRKNYFYPDNPKNFQITQNETPIGRDGYVEIEIDGNKKKIEIEEMHIEEDTSKSVHGEKTSLLDFNRAGVPLIEIVTKPCINSEIEAVKYLEKLRELLIYADVSDCKIEEGSMRCEPNISISKTDKLGTKIEVKNIGSISNVGEAIEYEVNRQKEILENNGILHEETRRFDDKTKTTILMRRKETGNDYRYFPEPDIPYVHLTDEFIEDSLKDLSRMPDERRNDYKNSGILPINIEKIIANKPLSDYLERFSDINLVIASNLLLGDISAYLNRENKSIMDTKLNDEKFRILVNKLDKNDITNKIFKEILTDIMETDKSIDDIINEKGLALVNDDSLIIKIIDKVLDENKNILSDYLNGNERSAKALMGCVMKEGKGKINPGIANQKLMEKLEELKTKK